MLKIALAYIRVSSDGQEDNSSLADQRRSIVAYAQLNGFVIEETFADVDSGAKETRVGLTAMRERIKKGNFAAVIVAKVDRFTRDLPIGEKVRHEIEKQGGKLISIAEVIDTSTPMGIFFIQLLQAMAQLDKNSIVQKLNQGKKSTIEGKGTFGGGTLPYGYMPSGIVGEASVNSSEEEVIKLIYKLHKENLSPYRICTILESKNFKTRNGKDFYPLMIYRILKRAAVYGAEKPINFNFQLKEGVKAKQPRIL